MIESLGYVASTGSGFCHPNGRWIFDLYRGQTIFQTALFDPRPVQADPALLLGRMVESKDARVLEGVPVVLTNALLKNAELKLDVVEDSLPNGLRRRFRMLVAVTYHFLFWVPEGDVARKLLLNYLRQREPSLLEEVQNKLNSGTQLSVGMGARLDPERLEKTYKNYVVQQFMETHENLSKKLDEQRQSTFLQALGELFTERQRDLLFKLLNKATLTKTERVLFSNGKAATQSLAERRSAVARVNAVRHVGDKAVVEGHYEVK